MKTKAQILYHMVNTDSKKCQINQILYPQNTLRKQTMLRDPLTDFKTNKQTQKQQQNNENKTKNLPKKTTKKLKHNHKRKPVLGWTSNNETCL